MDIAILDDKLVVWGTWYCMPEEVVMVQTADISAIDTPFCTFILKMRKKLKIKKNKK